VREGSKRVEKEKGRGRLKRREKGRARKGTRCKGKGKEGDHVTMTLVL